MKYIANVITSTRIAVSLLIMFIEPFSGTFFKLYAFCGFSDMIDGYIARKAGTGSDLGAILDSIADLVFILAVLICIIPVLVIPMWLVLLAAAIALIRIGAYIIGYRKYKTFSSLHTYLNKLTGLLLFASPVLYIVQGIEMTGIILGAAGLVSAVEELVIMIRSKDLNRDIKSILIER